MGQFIQNVMFIVQTVQTVHGQRELGEIPV